MSAQLDLICIGRAAVDLYADQVGSSLEDVTSFRKYLGGSSGNIAFGTARMGLKSAMLVRVGDEQFGRFVTKELARSGCDVSSVIVDTERLTGQAILALKDKETFPLLFYRQNCADMGLTEEDINPAFIRSANALLVTGTHLSQPGVYAASTKALRIMKESGGQNILDIDYRPVLWGLASLGDGETRFIEDSDTSSHLQTVLPLIDLLVGTEEEIQIAGGSTDTIQALKTIRSLTDATIVLKLGPLGCTVLRGVTPESMDDFDVFSGVRVEVMNVLGAGDAFLSGFLRGWLNGETDEQCCAYANACGALVVSRHGCSPAMPSKRELDVFMSERLAPTSKKLQHLHRVTTERISRPSGDLCIFAFDHRKQLIDMCRELGVDFSRIKDLKKILLLAARKVASELKDSLNPGVLIDDTFGLEPLCELTGIDWWIGRPVEEPSSRPIEFEGGDDISQRLVSWPSDHIVKCLVFYDVLDDSALRVRQEKQIQSLYQACCASKHELLLEIIPPANTPISGAHPLDVMLRMYNLGIKPDWWKLPPQNPQNWAEIDQLITGQDADCQGVVMLGLDAPIDTLVSDFKNSKNSSTCRGFAVGRSIFGSPSRQWLGGEIDDEQLIEDVSNNYRILIDAWVNRSN